MAGSSLASKIEAVQAKWATWNGMHEIHSVKIEGPFVNQKQFAVKSVYDVTDTQTGQRYTSMEEIAVYDVENGKITKEVFYSLQCK